MAGPERDLTLLRLAQGRPEKVAPFNAHSIIGRRLRTGSWVGSSLRCAELLRFAQSVANSPVRRARPAKSTRFAVPVLCRRLEMWTLTVFSLITSSRAISL